MIVKNINMKNIKILKIVEMKKKMYQIEASFSIILSLKGIEPLL